MRPLSKLALAGSALLAVCAGMVHAQVSDTPTNPFRDDPAAVQAGRDVFNSSCVACHGDGATGGRGPALNTGRFSRGGEDYEIFRTIHDGIPGTEMPSYSALPAEDIWRVVSYLRSLAGASPAAPNPAAAIPVRGDAKAGEALFFGSGGCASCHEVNGRGSASAADLSAIGALGPDEIRKGVLHQAPVRRPGVNARHVEATLTDGRRVSGLVRSEDSFTIHLLDDAGELLMLDRKHVSSLKTTSTQLAPKDVEQRLGEAGIDNVVAYLSTQKARDVAGAIQPRTQILPAHRIVRAQAEPHNWTTHWGDYSGRQFSELRQVTTANVGALQARWAAPLPGPSLLQAKPIVVDGVMYVAGSPGEVYALDARTGMQIWKFTRKQDVTNPYQINPSNRGVAVLDGRVFVGTLDNLVIAIDAATGRELWERRIADTMEGYTITGAPLALPGKIIVGVSGGEFGLRGFIDAFDPATGEKLWRFYTIPAPGEPGNETWKGDSWKLGGGGGWLTGSYDPELNLLYWAVGNPAPSFNPYVREGDNLYTNSVVALDPETGTLKWHYQFTPNDSHDWDAVQDLILAERTVNGRKRKVLMHADRNGFFYMLDRTNGEFLWARPFVRQNWNDGFDAKGRPIRRPGSVATPEGPGVFPAVGGTNFQAPSFDPQSGMFFVPYLDAQGAIASGEAEFERGRMYLGGRRTAPPGEPVVAIQGIKALDADTAREIWNFPLTRNSLSAGVLGTRGGVLFAASAEGNFLGLDMKTGAPLWRFRTGGSINASPISYAVGGEQYVAIAAGNTVYAFALPKDLVR